MEKANRRVASIASHLVPNPTANSKKEITFDEFKGFVGKELGTTDWFEIKQDQVNKFADATLDHQWIHVDPKRAEEESPFGGPIAHGFLSLSLLPYLVNQILPPVTGLRMGINYGLNKLRFISPVPVGSKVRAKFELAEITEVKPGIYQSTLKVTMEREGANKPVLVAEWLSQYFV